MITSLVALSIPQCPTSATSSLELITSIDDGSKAQGKEKTSLSSFWDDDRVAVTKAYDAISAKDLRPLATRPSHELM